MLQIENEYLLAGFRHYGAEMISLFDKHSKTEHVWQADTAFWGWYAPVLFPIVGRCFNDKIKIKDTPYTIEKHGFARKFNFDLLEHKADEITFLLKSNRETLLQYPFQFEFFIKYRLEGKQLITTYEVANKSSEEMPFCIGGHPALNVPFNDEERYEDYYIEFPEDKFLDRYFINESGFFNGQTRAILDGDNKLWLHEQIFKDDALIFKKVQSRTVFLKSKLNKSYLSFNFDDFNYLGLWAKPRAKYVCIEPWIGCSDADGFSGEMNEKEDVIELLPSKTFSCCFKLGIHTE